MSGRRHSPRHVSACLALAAVLAAAAALTWAAGCGSDEPSGEPDQTGAVLTVTADGGDTLGTLLVGTVPSTGEASVTVTRDTGWLEGGERIDPPALDDRLLGRRVAVWFTGPVAESFPVQATAAWIELLPSSASGIEGDVLVAGGPLSSTPRVQSGRRIAVHWGDEAGPVVAEATSDAAGAFRIDVHPGVYALVTLPDDAKMPGMATVRVKSGDYATVELVESVR